jgi:hypothetical protein
MEFFQRLFYRSELGRELTSSELTFADKIKKDCWGGIGNINSKNKLYS